LDIPKVHLRKGVLTMSVIAGGFHRMVQFRNVKLVMEGHIARGQLLTKDGVIEAILREDAPTAPNAFLVDGQGLYLSPGFVDLHVHGGGGSDFLDPEEGAIERAAKLHMRHGTTSMLPTLAAADEAVIAESIDRFNNSKEKMDGGPELLGLHLEGPCLSLGQIGALDPRVARNPNKEEYEGLFARAKGAILRWTIAPELPGALEMGDFLARRGCLPSIGHTDAQYSQVLEAFDHGFTLMTHLYSAMSTITRKSGFRRSGAIESAYIINGMRSEIIADGCHLPDELLCMAYRFIGPDRLCLVTDAMRAAGEADVTESVLGGLGFGLPVVIEEGVAKLPDRSALAGSIATCDHLIRVMRSAGVPLHDCVRMMAATPAGVIGASKRKGSLAPGKDADLVLFDEGINVRLVMLRGKIAHEEGLATSLNGKEA
jgi:N-acetylglucosamine-6-phosphate deacetylase